MKKGSEQHDLSTRLFLTACSGMLAESCTYPIDLTKTRLQLQGEGARLSSGQKMGSIAMATSIVRQEGVMGLFKGISPALLRHVPYTPVRIVLYEQLRKALSSSKSDPHKVPIWERLLCGATSGALGQLVASPADLVKVRMQADGKLVAQGKPPRYTSVWNAFSTIVANEGGVKALWRGWQPNVQRAALVNLGELATYDTAKQSLLSTGMFQDDIVCHTASSAISGLAAAICSCPADVVKTRMMNQMAAGPDAPVLYRSSLDCLKQAVQKEGAMSLFVKPFAGFDSSSTVFDTGTRASSRHGRVLPHGSLCSG